MKNCIKGYIKIQNYSTFFFLLLMEQLHTTESKPHVPAVIQTFLMPVSKCHEVKLKVNASESRGTVA